MTGQDIVPGTAPRPRTIGTYGKAATGPRFICVAGIHGNEPAGVIALQRVFRTLQAQQTPVNGQFIGLIGNSRALAAKQRYLDRDLNRMWTADRLQAIGTNATTTGDSPEALEQSELIDAIRELTGDAPGEVYFLDLHTTSSNSQPFAIFGDTIRNRVFANHLKSTMILGLEEALAGTMIEYLTNLGHVAVVFEAGQHDDPASIARHEAAIWVSLVAAGVLARDQVLALRDYKHTLERAATGLPRVLEVSYRHAISVQDEFRMEPGFVNFQRIRHGQLLARDRRGEIRARGNSHILMPLYQGLGDDGYFLARPVRRLWLRLSSVLRKIHLDDYVHWLPGVARHPAQRTALIVNTRVARLLAMELFHLLGFRRETWQDGVLIVSKRQWDLTPPPRQPQMSASQRRAA